MHKFVCRVCYEWVPSRVMRKIVCRLWLNEVSRQWRYPQGLPPWLNRPVGHCLRVRKILDEAADELAALKKAGNYNPIEIARVFRKACAKLGEKEVKSAIIKPLMDEIGLYESSDAAAKAFGSLAGPMTKNNHKEQYATIYSVTIGSKKVYFNGNIQTGGHNNVHWPHGKWRVLYLRCSNTHAFGTTVGTCSRMPFRIVYKHTHNAKTPLRSPPTSHFHLHGQDY